MFNFQESLSSLTATTTISDHEENFWRIRGIPHNSAEHLPENPGRHFFTEIQLMKLLRSVESQSPQNIPKGNEIEQK